MQKISHLGYFVLIFVPIQILEKSLTYGKNIDQKILASSVAGGNKDNIAGGFKDLHFAKGSVAIFNDATIINVKADNRSESHAADNPKLPSLHKLSTIKAALCSLFRVSYFKNYIFKT